MFLTLFMSRSHSSRISPRIGPRPQLKLSQSLFVGKKVTKKSLSDENFLPTKFSTDEISTDKVLVLGPLRCLIIPASLFLCISNLLFIA